MISEVFWIKKFLIGRLGTMARPRGGDWLEDEVTCLKRDRVEIVVCALTHNEMRELELEKEGELCLSQGIDFRHFPLADRGLPVSMSDWSEFILELTDLIKNKKSIVGHCRMGIGRATIIAVSIMVACGVDADEAFMWVSEARGLEAPDTQEQKNWVYQFADYLSHK